MNRQEKKREKTIFTLKTIFMNLILEGMTLENITIREITQRGDYNRGTFYLYFQDKYELAEALVKDAIEIYSQAVTSPYKLGEVVLLEGFVPSDLLIFESIEKNKKIYLALDRLQIIPNIYERMEEACLNLFTTKIQLVQEETITSVDYRIFLHYQVAAMIGLIKYWIRNDFKESASYLSKQFTSFYTNKVKTMNIIQSEQ